MSNDRTKRLAQQGRLNRRAFLRVTGTAAAAASVGAAGLFGRRGSVTAADPKRGGTLRILQIEPAVGFNPVLEGGNWPETQRMVYNGLTDFSPTSELVPGLARSWTVSEAADTFTFQLTPGVKFHDGHDLTAEDVKFTYEMVVDSTVGSPFAGYLPNLKSVEAPETGAVTFKFNGPNVPGQARRHGAVHAEGVAALGPPHVRRQSELLPEAPALPRPGHLQGCARCRDGDRGVQER